jgi:hypothetical protein
MKKKSFIKSDTKGTERCPFGLPITKACLHAGDSTTHMCPLEFVDKYIIKLEIDAYMQQI